MIEAIQQDNSELKFFANSLMFGHTPGDITRVSIFNEGDLQIQVSCKGGGRAACETIDHLMPSAHVDTVRVDSLFPTRPDELGEFVVQTTVFSSDASMSVETPVTFNEGELVEVGDVSVTTDNTFLEKWWNGKGVEDRNHCISGEHYAGCIQPKLDDHEFVGDFLDVIQRCVKNPSMKDAADIYVFIPRVMSLIDRFPQVLGIGFPDTTQGNGLFEIIKDLEDGIRVPESTKKRIGEVTFFQVKSE